MRAIRLFAVLLAVLHLGFVPTAYAASSPWRGISVTLYDLSAGKEPTLVIAGTLPKDTKLPVTVTLPVPSESEIVWMGEVYGGDSSKDIPLPYKRTKGVGHDLLEVTINKANVVQAELVVPDDWIKAEGQVTQITMSWTAAEEVPGVLMGFELPRGLEARSMNPAEVTSRETASGTFYSSETLTVSPGQTLTLSAEVTQAEPADKPVVNSAQPTGDAETADGDGGSGLVLPVLAGVLAVVVAGVGALLLKRRAA